MQGNRAQTAPWQVLILTLAVVGLAFAGLPAYAQSYQATRLTSDIANISNNTDANLENPWGLVASSSGPWWVSDNGTGLSTLYDGMGVPQPLVVTIPSADGSGTGVPTGIAFNSTNDFQLSTGNPATFLFVTEDGTVQGWNHNVNPTSAVIEVNNANAVYKGMALASAGGANYLYATNFHAGTWTSSTRTSRRILSAQMPSSTRPFLWALPPSTFS